MTTRRLTPPATIATFARGLSSHHSWIFLWSVVAGVGPATFNLVVFTFTIGFSININLMAVLGVVFATYLFRWY